MGMQQIKLVKCNGPDTRTLKQILDSINEVTVTLPYVECASIQQDIAEIWRRCGTGYGEWIKTIDDHYTFFKCSVCGHEIESPSGTPDWPYCPKCGSDMVNIRRDFK